LNGKALTNFHTVIPSTSLFKPAPSGKEEFVLDRLACMHDPVRVTTDNSSFLGS
jgi:hypothetical protein